MTFYLDPGQRSARTSTTILRGFLAAFENPVHLILGEEDRLTPARETAARAGGALENAGNRDATIRLLRGADHAWLVRPDQQAPWLADRPAAGWVAQMVDWARRH